jgi:copper chaperone CopZ
MRAEKPMQSTDAWVVRRRIKIPVLQNTADTEEVESTVGELPGVRNVTLDLNKHQVIVHYDASQSSYREIVQTMQDAGFPPSDSWWNRIKGGWYQYTDENARDNAKAPTPACCNKPPK